MTKFHQHLKSLGYGTIILYRKHKYCFIEGAEGDILMDVQDKGMWHFVEEVTPWTERRVERVTFGRNLDWKKYSILVVGNEI